MSLSIIVQQEKEVGACLPLEAVNHTHELANRPLRAPRHELENKILKQLSQDLLESPETILQSLADAILEGLDAQSSGISLLTDDGKAFYWPAVGGLWTPNQAGGTPRDFGPCGDVLDNNSALLFKRPVRRYQYISAMSPEIDEVLLVPFYFQGLAVGTVWALSHDPAHLFDSEDLRMLTSLSQFASSAYSTRKTLSDLQMAHEESERLHLELALANQHRQQELKDQLQHVSSDFTRVDDELRNLIELVSRQIQEPANIVASYLKLLAVRYKGRLGVDADEFIDKCLKSSHATIRMLDNLWHYSNTITGNVDYQAIDLTKSMAVVLSKLSELISTTNASIEIPESLPTVFANLDQIQFILFSLFENSIQYARPGSQPQIKLNCEELDREWILSVEDAGLGISAMDRENVFKPFFRVSARPDGEATGMSLAICRRMVAANGGRMWLDSSDSGRTKFLFALPKENKV